MRWTRRDTPKPSAAPIIEDVPFFTKGQRPDSLLPAPIAGNSNEQLQKAERVLGISHRQSSLVTPSNARQRGSKSVVSPQESAGSDRWGTHSRQQEHQPMDNARSANGGLKPWPSLQSTINHASMHDMRASGAGWAPPAHPTSNKPAYHHQIPREPSNSTLRSHYEASQQPLAVSPQTSSSATREMGLRKASSGATSNRHEVETSGRPLKSVLKQPSHEPEHMDRPASKKEGSRKPKFGGIFSKHQPSNRGLFQPSRNESSLSVASSTQPYGRTPSFGHSSEALASPAPGSVSTDSTTRPKVFESDVFDSAKVHVRRPPKGIQNWFDGVDVSSDEEDQRPSEALPSTFSPYEDHSYHAVSQGKQVHGNAQRKDAYDSSAHQQSQKHRSSRQPNQQPPNYPRNISDTFVEENALAIDLARQRMQGMHKQAQNVPRNRRDSTDSYAPSSFSHAQSIMTGAHHSSSEYSGTKHDPETKYGRSRVPVESLLSMSEYSEYDDQPGRIRESLGASSHYTADAVEASPVGVRRPSVAPRPFTIKRSNTRDTVMTTQTSGSIPIHWSNEEPMPMPMPALPMRATEDDEVDHTSDALRRLIGRGASFRTHPSRPASSRYTYDDSVAGDTNDDSQPSSDISRMMAVTEEEMALLEMMRLKRAAMQKGDISEGAQQILKREQEQLAASQKAAQKSAQNLARAKEERERTQPDQWAYDVRPDYERIAGLGSLLEEDADEKLRIERFLASETPLEDVFPFPSPPIRSRDNSIVQMDDLLLPRTYTPQPPEPKPQRAQKKTTSRVPPAPSTASGASEFDADESAQLEAELRQFLGGDEPSESSAFPMPPKASSSSRRSSRRVLRSNGQLAPVLPSTREEEFTPPLPNRSAKRAPAFSDESVLPPSDRTMHLRADSDALIHSFPPTIATQFARPPPNKRLPEPPTPSDTSERLSAFLGPNFEHSLDMSFPSPAGTGASQSSNPHYDSPSISTSQASPLTPTFPTPVASNEKHRGIEIANIDTSSGYLHTYDGTDQSSLRTASSTQSGSQSLMMSKHRKSKAIKPAPLDMLSPATYNNSRTPSRMSSNGSCMSASDDVLAAWAELGGVSDGLPTRGRSPMPPR
jgi:hypothetical protein